MADWGKGDMEKFEYPEYKKKLYRWNKKHFSYF